MKKLTRKVHNQSYAAMLAGDLVRENITYKLTRHYMPEAAFYVFEVFTEADLKTLEYELDDMIQAGRARAAS